MSEVADMMLDGTLCEECGMALKGGPVGYPVRCGSCQQGVDRTDKAVRKAANIAHAARQKKTKCPHCGKRVKEVGLAMHIQVVHPEDHGDEG